MRLHEIKFLCAFGGCAGIRCQLAINMAAEDLITDNYKNLKTKTKLFDFEKERQRFWRTNEENRKQNQVERKK